MREPDYYAAAVAGAADHHPHDRDCASPALMGLGAIFGAVKTMYTAVASRERAKSRRCARSASRDVPVVVSVLAEVAALEPRRRGHRRTAGVARVRRLPDVHDELPVVQPGRVRVCRHAQSFDPGPDLRAFMGLIGGLLPAIRAARLPIVTALREL